MREKKRNRNSATQVQWADCTQDGITQLIGFKANLKVYIWGI